MWKRKCAATAGEFLNLKPPSFHPTAATAAEFLNLKLPPFHPTA